MIMKFIIMMAGCQFSNWMSSSQFQCHLDVIYDTKVRIRANGGAGIDPLDAHSGPVIFTQHGIDDITWCYRAARHNSFPSFRRQDPSHHETVRSTP